MNTLPILGAQVPRRGSAPTRWVGRAALALLGWRVEGELPDRPKFVIAIAPHTSNWDFVVGAAAMFALDIRVAFISKHTIFRWPFRGLLRWMGSIPVDRSSAHGTVAASVEAFTRVERRVLVIAPEGTRRKVEKFRTGFLHIARGANVPVALAALDYAARCVRLGPAFEVGADIEEERRETEAFFAPIRGRRTRR